MKAKSIPFKALLLVSSILALFVYACDDDEDVVTAPSVHTVSVVDVTDSSAVAAGQLLSDGGTTIIRKGFNYSTDSTFLSAYETVTTDTGNWIFGARLSSLLPETKYFYRAFAENSQYPGYGEVKSFTTLPAGLIQYLVRFNVDMHNIVFNPVEADVYISGDFAGGWAIPGSNPLYMMYPSIMDSMIYSIILRLDKGGHYYKYFFIHNDTPSWDYAEWAGEPNRAVEADSDKVVNNVWGLIGSK